jgi:putative transposase
LPCKEIAIRMDGHGRALDNVFIERLWWTVKFEEVYTKDSADGRALNADWGHYLEYCNRIKTFSARQETGR